MCGRFSQSLAGDAIAEAFQLAEVPDWQPRHNIAPTQTIPAIVATEKGNRHFKPLRWGLIPSWSKDPAIGAKMINARSETVAENLRSGLPSSNIAVSFSPMAFMSSASSRARSSLSTSDYRMAVLLRLLACGSAGKPQKVTY